MKALAFGVGVSQNGIGVPVAHFCQCAQQQPIGRPGHAEGAEFGRGVHGGFHIPLVSLPRAAPRVRAGKGHQAARAAAHCDNRPHGLRRRKPVGKLLPGQRRKAKGGCAVGNIPVVDPGDFGGIAGPGIAQPGRVFPGPLGAQGLLLRLGELFQRRLAPHGIALPGAQLGIGQPGCAEGPGVLCPALPGFMGKGTVGQIVRPPGIQAAAPASHQIGPAQRGGLHRRAGHLSTAHSLTGRPLLRST